ncbi:MAG: isocitrate/isopropylmalate dehydrogenase family protein [Nitrosopumilus sp.]|nr:isocitrate/isopropylmalate dehydrogenase family protein [Nitrosopumilus sp.]MDA7943338.1 isocitrate/isopropylmalate dehydrogenase family protein [Nitrosopumilus sp.]MDA7999186.1 isocitrate/isopropylmalate dehydrogenase family protein [Nitrosopumilus sp.]
MYHISMVRGDGIGPELADAARIVLDRLGAGLEITDVDAGDGALERTGSALPAGSLEAIRSSDACLKAPVGESAADVIVELRRRLDLYANIRPARSQPGAGGLRDDIDLVIVRENTEDLYTGAELDLGGAAVALRIVTEAASERIARRACEIAAERGGRRRVTCVHKSNVMRISDGMFASACARVAAGYDVEFEEMYVDACAMNLVRRPEYFDVIVTTNMFGDILSDESSQVAGGLGMAPAANEGDSFAIFEPVHGAAFDIAGTGSANPASFLLSAAMMCRWLGRRGGDAACSAAGDRLERAVRGTVASGKRTRDIGGDLSTEGFARAVADAL